MFRNILVWALICSTTPLVCAQGREPYDSLSITLDEVTVTSRSLILKNDRKVIIPTRDKIATSTTGLDILQRIALPGITVNQLTGHINLTAGGVLKLYINGVPATEGQIAAIDPAEILRIEYHDSPGARYDGADAVIDYIVRRDANGGRVFLESMDCIGNGKFATIDEMVWQQQYGKSVWAVNGGYMRMDRDNWVRDYEELWRYPDHDVTRREQGLPVRVGMSMLDSDLSYSYVNSESDLLNTRISLRYNDVPYKEEGDRHSLLTTSESAAVTEISEHTAERSLHPSFGIHYRHRFGRDGSISVNLDGAWLHSHSSHTYSERQEDGDMTSDIRSESKGDKYSMGADMLYELRLGPGTVSTGIRHRQSYISNQYTSNMQYGNGTTKIGQAESSVFAEYNIRIANWGFVVTAIGKRVSVSQGERSIRKYAVLPSANISYRPVDDLFLRYDFRIDCKLPSLAYMSGITQDIQPGMIRRGNPSVRPFIAAQHGLTAAYSRSLIGLNLSVDYLDESNPVMNRVVYENGVFVSTYENQPYFRKLGCEAMITLKPLGDIITMWVAPSMTRYFSKGADYSIAKNIFHLHFGADLTYRQFVFTACTMSGAANSMYGDEMITEKPMNMILAGYKRNSWSVQAGVFNLMKNYWMKTENFSPLTPYSSKAHCGKNTYFAVKLSLNINYGKPRAFSSDIDSVEGTVDRDSGIVTGLK